MVDADSKRLSRLTAILTQLQTRRLLTATGLAGKFNTEAIDKIKAVLRQSEKDKANLLADRTRFEQNINRERNSNHLSALQHALTGFHLVKIDYTNEQNKTTGRIVEPFALISTMENWLMIAWCRLRKEFRYFRLDRIQKMEVLGDRFKPHPMTLQEFFDKNP